MTIFKAASVENIAMKVFSARIRYVDNTLIQMNVIYKHCDSLKHAEKQIYCQALLIVYIDKFQKSVQ